LVSRQARRLPLELGHLPLNALRRDACPTFGFMETRCAREPPV